MNPKDVLELTINELDDLFDGFAKANEDSTDKPKKALEGKDAVDALKNMGFLA